MGYEISPVLWKKIRKGLSAGRVQSVATRIICDREAEIENFIPKEYWSINTQFKKEDGLIFSARFHGKNGKKFEIKNKDESDEILALLKDSNFRVSNVKKSQKKRNPSPPFITSTLQQEASRKLGYSAQKTMMIAQQLYEGVEIGSEGSVGLITYMRTDSVRLSDNAVKEARDYILENFGKSIYRLSPDISRPSQRHRTLTKLYVHLMQKEPDSLKDWLSLPININYISLFGTDSWPVKWNLQYLIQFLLKLKELLKP